MQQYIKNNISIFMLLLLPILGIKAQLGGGGGSYTISQSNTAYVGQTTVFTVSGPNIQGTNSWNAFGGTVSNTSGLSTTVTWNTAGNAFVGVNVVDNFFNVYYTSKFLTVQTPLSAGSIFGAQTICYNGNPSNLSNSASASGGSGGGYTYQWQYSNNGSSGWTNISGATSTSYDPPGGLTASRWYRRRVQRGTGTAYTSSVKVTVNPQLASGSVGGAQTICYGGDPGNLANFGSPSGGNGSYVYQWQYSANGSSGWTNISGANSSSYNPPGGLTASRWYRRRVQSCGETQYANTVKVTVNAQLASGSISGTQTICYNGDPNTLGNSSSASGGDGSYAYQWQYSANGSSGWTDISGGTSTTYNPPGGLTADRWYRRRVISCGQTKYSASIKVTVNPVLVAGSISGDQSIVSGGDPTVLSSTGSASGGSGSYAYQWQYSANGSGGWTNISGATSTSYDPPSGLNVERWYRRAVTSLCTAYTASVKVSLVLPFYRDADGDGFGDANSVVYGASPPQGYVSNSSDQCPTFPGTGNGCGYTAPTMDDENYVHTRTYQTAMSSSASVSETGDVMEQMAYFDGLGRPMQNLALRATPDGQDMITHQEYDGFGRMAKEYLPYPDNGTTGNMRTGAKSGTDSFYTSRYSGDINGANPNPYSEKLYENSPLNRVLQQAAPGEDWELGSGHEIAFAYEANGANEVRRFTVSFASNDPEAPQLSQNGYCTAGELRKTITYDENHDGTSSKLHSMEEFMDKLGRVVLKRTYADMDLNQDGDTNDAGESEVPHETYYVYDSYNNLTYVIPPKVTTASVSATELDELCYQYKYDHRNRLVEKKIPGKDWDYIVYNKLDQPVMTQDGNQRPNKEWLFTKYDAFGRVAYTGLHTQTNVISRTTMQGYVTANANQFTARSAQNTIAGTPMFYSNTASPGSISEVYTINYYDSYVDTDGQTVPATVLGQTTTTNVQGLPTVSKVRVLDTNDWITTITGYDEKGRAVYTSSKNNYLNTTDVVETKLDFLGRPVQVVASHTKGSNAAIVTTDNFTYDHMGRLLTQTQTLGGHTETLVENSYDELGQLVEKKVGGGLQTVDYQYNVRGWLKQINDPNSLGNDLFAFRIAYNDPVHGGTPQYIENLSESEWKTANDNVTRWYRYSYDGLNRMESADSYNGNYDVSFTYDKMGNITALNRKGHTNSGATTFGTMDDLVYTYGSGNKLTKVLDNGNDTYGFRDGANTATEYTYDQNGNMISDTNKGITAIEYNHLNMPTKITVTGSNAGVLDYVYAADGTKLRKINSNGTTTDYAGNYVYEGGSLKQITHPEGYIEPDGSGWQYVYRLTDIWDNTRVTFADDNGDGSVNATEIRREQNYYPGGLQHKGYNSASYGVENNLKTYQKQEFTEDLGLGFHEWRYRASYPDLVRFWQIDPLAEDYMYNSTHAFQENKFGMGVELEGLENAQYGYNANAQAAISRNQSNLTAEDRQERDNMRLVAVSLVVPGPEDVVLAGLAATKIGGAVMKGLSKLFSKSSSKAKTLQKNKEIGKQGEQLVNKELKSEFPDDEVRSQVTGKFEDGSSTVFDDVVIDSKTGKVKVVNETKTGDASLTKQQKRFHNDGETTTLTGKNAGSASGQKINTTNTSTRTTRKTRDEVQQNQ